MSPRSLPLIFSCLVAVAVAGQPASARQMDLRQVAGVPLPVPDVPTGTVTVRIIRGSLTNNVPDQPVELTVAGQVRKGTTDATGRVQFSGLQTGAETSATATVAGERLQSQTFRIPASGGIRLLLVATDPNAATPPAAAAAASSPVSPGAVVLGEQSRFVFEFGDRTISVFNILQVMNTSPGPVEPPQPIAFELPAAATGATVLQDSSPQAELTGKRIAVKGPFAPGATIVQFAYSMEYSGPRLTIEQKMPASLSRVIVLAQKGGEMRLESPQMTEQREMAAEGHTYIVGQGPAVQAGTTLSFHFSNLPHAPRWPRNVALALAIVILAAGAWASSRVPKLTMDRGRERLEQRRERLFGELTALEQQHRAGGIDPAYYAERRGELVAALERVYAEIDRRAA